MRARWLLLAAFALSGCAHDNYSVIAGGSGTEAKLHDDLRDCKHVTIAAFENGQSHTGALLGVLGGGLGGAIGGAIDANNGTMKPSDIDPAIETCMRDKGYAGTSEN